MLLPASWCRRHSTLLLLLSFWALGAGTVWEIKVKVGDTVKAGDTLVREPSLQCCASPCCLPGCAPLLSVALASPLPRPCLALASPLPHPCLTPASPLPRPCLTLASPALSLPRLLQIVLEAMKMEAAVVAPCDGTVKDIHVQSADMVQQGNPMCLLV